MATLLEKAIALRGEAMAAWMTSPDFAAFKASDEFVVKLGGKSALPAELLGAPDPHGTASAAIQQIGANAARRLEIHAAKRITQVDAAEAALREAGEPLPIGRFMAGAMTKGAEMKGADPLANFRSAVSKDDRFYSFKRNNMYFWWFKGEPLPPGWIETASPDLVAGLAASSVSSSQEGGEGHGPATT